MELQNLQDLSHLWGRWSKLRQMIQVFKCHHFILFQRKEKKYLCSKRCVCQSHPSFAWCSLAGCLQRDPTPTHDPHSRKRQADTPARLYDRKTSQKNLKNKEPPRTVTDDNVGLIIYCLSQTSTGFKNTELAPSTGLHKHHTRLFSHHTSAKWILYHPCQVCSYSCSAALPPIRCVCKKVK